MDISRIDYDLVVIGSGPGGQRAAIQGAKMDRRVLLIERKAVVGGICINLGTIPSKTLREAVLYLSGYRERGIYGESYQVKPNITMGDLLLRIDHVTRHEIDVTRHQLQRNGVGVINGTASFESPNTVRIDLADGQSHQVITADRIVVATGTEATKDPHIPFDCASILTSDDVFGLNRLPKTMAVVGAG